MLNFVKPLSTYIMIMVLNGCGYQSPNSDKFPHKHIKELNSSTQELQFEKLIKTSPTGIKSITPQYMIYDCSEKTLDICSYDFHQHKNSIIDIPKTHQNQFIDSITALTENTFVIVVDTYISDSQHEYTAYILSSDTQQLSKAMPFSYIHFSRNILEQLTAKGIYKKQKNEFGDDIYSDQTYVANKQAEQKQREEEQNNRSLWQFIQDLFNIKAEPIADNFSPWKFQVAPLEPFNQQFTVQFKQYLAQQQVECYSVLDGRLIDYALLKTPQHFIFTTDFESQRKPIMNTFKIPLCKINEPLPTVNKNYLKYQSIDDVQGSGNHFIFWFTPIGYDVFEIRQHGQIKQFKLPIDRTWMYQINNDLIISIDQSYYIIPVS